MPTKWPNGLIRCAYFDLMCCCDRHDISGSAATINSWVAEKTDNKITELVPENDIDSLTRLILVNAVYFKGNWLKTFHPIDTRDRNFYLSEKKTIRVDMMYKNAEFYYGVSEELKCQAVELPYDGDTLSMFVLLPDRSATNLSELEKKLTSDDLINVTKKFRMASSDVHLSLPKFRLDEKLSLAESLSGMGMKDLFTESVADLSGIDGTKNLYVSKVLHRAVVDVNEEGTEAAAAISGQLVFCSFNEDEPPQIYFNADRPFLFFIQDKATGAILFLGRLTKPPASSRTRNAKTSQRRGIFKKCCIIA